MENIVYIVLIIIWLAVSFLKKKPNQTRQAPKKSSEDGAETTAPSAGKEMDMEEMFEEFFGGSKKKEKEREQALPQKEKTFYRETESPRSAPHEYKWQQQETEEQPLPENIREQASIQENASIIKTQTIEELIAAHKKEEALRLAQEEENQEDFGIAEGIPEFDLRQAVIFSEILNRKYH